MMCKYSNFLSCIFIKNFWILKKRYSVSFRGCSNLNVKILVIGLGECNNLFFSVFFRYTRSLKQKYHIFKNCHKLCAKPS